MPTVSFSNSGFAQSVGIELGKIAAETAALQRQSITGKRNNMPKEEPTNQALYAQAMATCTSLDNGINNASQATKYFNVAGSAMLGAKEKLIACQEFCVQANSTLMDSASRKTLQTSLEGILGLGVSNSEVKTKGSLMSAIDQTVWMGQPILSGGSVEGPLSRVSIPTVTTIENYKHLDAPGDPSLSLGFPTSPNVGDPTSFIVDEKTIGSFDGIVSHASVVPNATPGTGDVSLTVGIHVYKGTGCALEPNKEWHLVSKENGAVITIRTSAVTGLNHEEYENHLKKVLGLLPIENDEVAIPVQLTSGSLEKMPDKFTITTTDYAPSGSYTLASVKLGTTTYLSLSNGITGEKKAVSTTGPSTFKFFGNSITVAINVGLSTLDDTPNYKFELKNSLPFRSQTGATRHDVMEGRLPRIEPISLGLANHGGVCDLDLTSTDGANFASQRLAYALEKINAISSEIGTLQSRSSAAGDSSSTLFTNLSDAASVYDAVNAPLLISRTVEMSLRSGNAVNCITPGFIMSIQLKNQLATANQLAAQT